MCRIRNYLLQITPGRKIRLLLVVFLLLIGTIPTKPEDACTPPTYAQNNFIGNQQFFIRSDWDARPPKQYTKVTGPVDMVIIKHTAGRYCDSFIACAKIVAELQSDSDSKGYPDIYCNFLIGGDGYIFEGRGWCVQPEFRKDTVDIVFIGNYDIDEVTPKMTAAALTLIEDGVKKKYLTTDHLVVCHNQTMNTISPGKNVIKEVRKWPHYDPNLHFGNNLG